MQGVVHRTITRAVLRSELPAIFAKYIDQVAENADLPDRTDDIQFGGFGTKVAGHRVCSLGHFVVPTTAGHFRGYNWHSDSSLWHCIRRFDPRVGNVACRTDAWRPIVGAERSTEHPLARLISDLRGKATLDADNVTFPTAAIMADWLWRYAQDPFPNGIRTPPPPLVGSVCHWIQDASVPHHARGWLSKGHASYEARQARLVDQGRSDELLLMSSEVIRSCGLLNYSMARSIVEHAATMAYALTPGRGSELESVVNGMAWTRAFVRNLLIPEL